MGVTGQLECLEPVTIPVTERAAPYLALRGAALRFLIDAPHRFSNRTPERGPSPPFGRCSAQNLTASDLSQEL